MKNNLSQGGAYIKRIERVYAHRGLVRAMRLVGAFAVLFTVAVFGHILAVSLIGSVKEGVKLLAVSAVPFILVSVMRRALNWQRPYQVYDLSSVGIERPKDKNGSSFPSRHVFSSFLIGVLALEFSLPLGRCPACNMQSRTRHPLCKGCGFWRNSRHGIGLDWFVFNLYVKNYLHYGGVL